MAIQVFTTVDTKKKAQQIADSLIKQKVAACVQIIPINSTYRWKGKIEHAEEWLCLIKGKNFKTIEKEIKKVHPYEVPEIIALPIKKANKEYLNWLKKETR